MRVVISALLVFVLLFGAVFALTSCYSPSSEAEKAEANLKKKDYVVVSIPTPIIAGIDRSFSATKYDKDQKRVEWVQIFFISENAEDVYKYIEGFLEKEQKSEDNKDRKIEYGKKEGVVWFGTANAVRDFQ